MKDTKLNQDNLNQSFIEGLVNNLDLFTTSRILEHTLNALMKAERNIHLTSNQDDKGNGFYQRSLGTPLGELDLSVPRDRDGDFRPQVLPDKYIRDTEDRFKTLKALFTQSYSPAAINAIFNKLGLSYSKKEMEELKEHYLNEYEAWAKKDLPHDCIGIFVDAYISEVNHEGKVKKLTTFVVLGFDFEGFKDLYAIELNLGNESKEYWLSVFNRLINRGLKCPLFVVSDDFSGITDAVATLFPKSLHQLCYVHLQRNIRKNMCKADAKDFNSKLSNLKNSKDFETGLNDFNSFLDSYKDKYQTYVKYLKNNSKYYLAFLHLQLETRKYFYTTNSVESFNSILDKKRNLAGGFFQSMDYLKINIYIHYKSLKTQKWRKPSPLIKANIYFFNQLFAQIFERLPNFQTQPT